MIQKVAVIGAGIMGNQIAMQVAIHGYDVVCYDLSEKMVEKAAEFSKGWFEKRVAKGKMSQADADEIQGRLIFTNDIQKAGENADMVIEAVSDVVAIKKSALGQIDKITLPHCIYASNSSYILSSRFCDAV